MVFLSLSLWLLLFMLMLLLLVLLLFLLFLLLLLLWLLLLLGCPLVSAGIQSPGQLQPLSRQSKLAVLGYAQAHRQPKEGLQTWYL